MRKFLDTLSLNTLSLDTLEDALAVTLLSLTDESGSAISHWSR
jgi:hypothetical protein